MVFPVVMYGCESWTIKKAEGLRFDAFELWCWRRLLTVPWTARRSNQSILREITPGCSLEGLMLNLKLPIVWPPHVKSWLIGKDPDARRDWAEFTQTHVLWVSDAIQPSHPLSSPFPPALNLSQHQGLFKWVTSLHEVGKVLEFQLQHQSFQWTPRSDLL